MRSVSLIIPTTVDRSNPCCCADPLLTEASFPFTVLPIRSPNIPFVHLGYKGTSEISVNNRDYSLSYEITPTGDGLKGNMAIKDLNKEKNYQVELPFQRSSFPNLPCSHLWPNLAIGGTGVIGSLRLDDGVDSSTAPSLYTNKSVLMTFDATTLQGANTVLSAAKAQTALTGNDQTYWFPAVNQILKTVVLYDANGVTTFVPIIYTLESVRLVVTNGTSQLFGKLTVESNGVTNSRSFQSSKTSCWYSDYFPWRTSWLILDNKNAAQSILSSSGLLPTLDSDIQVSLSVRVDGKAR